MNTDKVSKLEEEQLDNVKGGIIDVLLIAIGALVGGVGGGYVLDRLKSKTEGKK